MTDAVKLVLHRDQYELLRRVLWSAGTVYQGVDGGHADGVQGVDGGHADGVLRMADLPPDFRDLMAVVSAARRTQA